MIRLVVSLVTALALAIGPGLRAHAETHAEIQADHIRGGPVKAHPVPATGAPIHINGEQAIRYAQEIVNFGPRPNGSAAHAKVEDLFKRTFAKDQLEADHFTPNTAVGPQSMTNYIVRFPGKKPGVIVLASHYETNYYLRNTSFVGANDGAATSGLLMEFANHLRGTPLEGYSIWLVFFDGEEATKSWSASDSLYGSRHLAAKWGADGTLAKIKAFFLFDMIGDKDLDILRDTNSTPWLLDIVGDSAKKLGYSQYFFKTSNGLDDDTVPFQQRHVPVADIIDFDYGPQLKSHPDGSQTAYGYHHSVEDTMDKISAKSLGIAGNTVAEAIAAVDRR